MLQYLVLLGAAVNIYGAIFYIRDTLRGKTKPNRVTWLMWSVAPLIATIAALAQGVSWAVLPVFMAGFVPLLIFIASFVNPNSYWKLGVLDYVCGSLSVLALVLWWVTKEANIAIIFAIASDGLAAVPTLVKSWRHPETESVVAYTTGLFNALTSFAAIKLGGFLELSFPIYLVIMNSSLIFVVWRRKIFGKKFAAKEQNKI
ncbi:hypothetical protein A3B87_01190 [Candidatus Kuenenbacteria bacterium RIFCSPHIGHO2_02_FULL_39_13]|uniref:Uncharacterized protein n=1 Tax=Candidatus Kuenenbacteria bacterium RIFCSPHIGHO2_02_FULL_39_13 TaxID=1798561 RepID=A0A1F6FM01_9BACT|nr:MAG: hypothetical protein A3B87_01190 [Candidatus Kuenenbacteria bacterium RIFCSPHIGHO2_02_FULL_39_13]